MMKTGRECEIEGERYMATTNIQPEERAVVKGQTNVQRKPISDTSTRYALINKSGHIHLFAKTDLSKPYRSIMCLGKIPRNMYCAWEIPEAQFVDLEFKDATSAWRYVHKRIAENRDTADILALLKEEVLEILKLTNLDEATYNSKLRDLAKKYKCETETVEYYSGACMGLPNPKPHLHLVKSNLFDFCPQHSRATILV